MIRKRCARRGHDWISFIDGYRPAFQVCARWLCPEVRPDPLLPRDVRELLQEQIDDGRLQ